MESDPIPFASAIPTENNIRKWSINIMGPPDTIFEGILFHYHFMYPTSSYPFKPPTFLLINISDTELNKIQLLTKIFKASPCPIVIETWKPAYTIRSVILQIQSCIMDWHTEFKDQKKFINVLLARKQAINGYQCPGKNCPHKGIIGAFPKFKGLKFVKKKKSQDQHSSQKRDLEEEDKDDQEGDEEEDSQESVSKNEDSIEEFEYCIDSEFQEVPDLGDTQHYLDSLECLVTKKSYQDCVLGFGVRMKIAESSQAVVECRVSSDLLSFSPFIKGRHKKCSERFYYLYWMPVPLGLTKMDRTLDLLRRSLSQIFRDTARDFNPEQAATFFPIAIFNLFQEIVEIEERRNITTIQRIIHLYSLYKMLEKSERSLKDILLSRLNTILEKYKSFTQIKNHSFPKYDEIEIKTKEMVVEAYNLITIAFLVDYQNKKQVVETAIRMLLMHRIEDERYWSKKEEPTIEDKKGWLQKALSKVRSDVRTICIFKTFCDHIQKEPEKETLGMHDYLVQNYCRLSRNTEESMMKDIRESIDSEDLISLMFYFKHMENPKTIEQSIEVFEHLFIKVSPQVSETQSEESEESTMFYQEYELTAIRICDYTIFSDMDIVSAQLAKVMAVPEYKWRQNCIKRWKWIACLEERGVAEFICPRRIAMLADTFDHINSVFNQNFEDPLKNIVHKWTSMFDTNRYKPEIVEEYSNKFGWRELFIKLEIEERIRLLSTLPKYCISLKYLYREIIILAPFIENLTLFLVPKKKLKSKCYYIAQILSYLSHLRVLRVKLCLKKTVCINSIRNLKKGLQNSITQYPGVLQKIELIDLTFEKNTQIELLSCFGIEDQFRSVTFQRCKNLSPFKNGAFFKYLSQITVKMEEFIIDSCDYTKGLLEGLSDLVIKQKNLKVFEFRSLNQKKCPLDKTAFFKIFQRFAYNSNLEHFLVKVDSFYLQYSYEIDKNLTEILKKHQKIKNFIFEFSQTPLKHLLNHIPFLKEIAIHPCLETLSFNSLKSFGRCNYIACFSQIISINALLKNKLKNLHLYKIGNPKIEEFGNYLYINDSCFSSYDIEHKFRWMERRHNHCSNLEVLDFSGANSRTEMPPNKQHYFWTANVSKSMYLFTRNPKLKHLKLAHSDHLDNSFFETIRFLYSWNPRIQLPYFGIKHMFTLSQLETLDISDSIIDNEDLSSMKIGIVAMKNLKYLDLSHNLIDQLDGEDLSYIIKYQTSLDGVNLYGNNLRVKGAKDLSQGLRGMSRRLEFLDLGNNGIREKGAAYFQEVANTGSKRVKFRFLSLRSNMIPTKHLMEIIEGYLPTKQEDSEDQNQSNDEDGSNENIEDSELEQCETPAQIEIILQKRRSLVEESKQILNLFLRKNPVRVNYLDSLSNRYHSNSLYLDLYDICYYQDPRKLLKSVYIKNLSGVETMEIIEGLSLRVQIMSIKERVAFDKVNKKVNKKFYVVELGTKSQAKMLMVALEKVDKVKAFPARTSTFKFSEIFNKSKNNEKTETDAWG